MSSVAAIHDFWTAFLRALPNDHPRPASEPPSWSFGDNPRMATELGALVVAGRKTATCSLLADYEADGEALPRVGGLSILTGGAGEPLCLIRTIEVVIRPYLDVDAWFAFDEGEGDRSLAYWRDAHRRFFSRRCSALGLSFAESMPVVCERFEVVYRAAVTKKEGHRE